MGYYNSSAARKMDLYDDIDSILPAQKPKRKQTRLKVVQRKKSTEAHFQLSIRTVLMFVAIVGSICIMLFNQAQLNEVNGEISAVRSEITQMQSEYVRMQSNLESNMSLRNIEKYAEQELGLQRINQYQVEYVCVYEDDTIEVLELERPMGFSEKVEVFAANIISRVKGLLNTN